MCVRERERGGADKKELREEAWHVIATNVHVSLPCSPRQPPFHVLTPSPWNSRHVTLPHGRASAARRPRRGAFHATSAIFFHTTSTSADRLPNHRSPRGYLVPTLTPHPFFFILHIWFNYSAQKMEFSFFFLFYIFVLFFLGLKKFSLALKSCPAFPT